MKVYDLLQHLKNTLGSDPYRQWTSNELLDYIENELEVFYE